MRIDESGSQRCGVSRREMIQVGALAPLGLALPSVASARNSLDGFGSAKRCILIYLWGAPSQLETFDPKPDAPVEVQGEFRSIASALPGVRVGQILPRIARLLDRVTILRTLTHDYPIHGTAFATTSVPVTDLQLEGNTRDPRHWPCIGSVVDYLGEKDDPTHPAVPRNFGLPFQIGLHRRVKPGPFGGFLGGLYDPMWSDFRAKGTREVLRDAGAPDVPTMIVADPFVEILPTDRFEWADSANALTLDRLSSRSRLLDHLDAARRASAPATSTTLFQRQRDVARAVVLSGKLREALDVQRERLKLREQYGMTLFGQSCLAARRLLQAGGKFVTVRWDEYGLVNTGWDTHVHLRSRMKDELGPGFDAAFATLLEDLDASGLLDETAIAVISEHGRTPTVQSVSGGGRDHWSRAYSAIFAGAGFAKGRVVGRTDRVAGDVLENPFSPKDVLATLYHLLGIDPQTEIHDRLNRPYAVGGSGRVRGELLA